MLLGPLAACSSPTKPTPDDGVPTLTCPASMTMESKDGKPVPVSYSTPVAIGGQRPVIVTCTPASGESFPVGSTTVQCRATDARSRQGTCSFGVTVTAPPRIEVELFMAFGDSLTEGKPAMLQPFVDFPGSYPRELQRMLEQRYTAQKPTVLNEAKAGRTAVEGLDDFPGLLLLHAPKAVLLMEGANDIARDDGDDYVPIAAEAIEEKVLEAQGRGATVFLATLPPQVPGGKRAKGAPFVPLMNEAIREVALQTGATLVDVHKAFDGKPLGDLVGWDGLHLEPAGYLLVAETFFEEIKKKLEVEAAASGDFPR